MITASWLLTITSAVIVLVATVLQAVITARSTPLSPQGRITLTSVIILGSVIGLLGVVGVIVFSMGSS